VLGGLIVASAGASAALLIDVGSFVICAALLLDLHPHVAAGADESVRARMRAALAHIAEVPAIRTLLMVEAVAFVFFESGGPIEVSYVKTTLSAGDGGVGLVLTVWGAGAVFGSIVFAHSLRRPLALMLTAGPLGIGLAYLGFAAAPTLAAACAAAFVGGIGNGLQYAALFSAVQRLTPQRLHGQLMGAVESLGSLGLALGLALGGALVALSSPRAAFLVVGLGTVAASLALHRSSRRDTRLTTREETPATPSPLAPQPLGESPPAHQPAPH
jgi:MFS family permease